MAVVAALQVTADSWWWRDQRGRHHLQFRDHAQRTVQEITERLTKETTRPRRKITVIPKRGKDS